MIVESTGWVLDLLLLGVLLAQAVAGWRQGLLVGVASLIGFGVGIGGGAALVGALVDESNAGPQRLFLVLGGGLVAGIVLQAVAVALAYRARRELSSRSVRALDTVVGGLAGMAAAAAVVWVLSWGLRTAPLPLLSGLVAQSRVVAVLDTAAPAVVQRATDRFFARVSGEWFPRVFRQGREEIREVPVPDSQVVGTVGVVAASDSVVKIRSEAEACDREAEGSGFVVAPGRVVTNAHVVAGAARPQVQVGGDGQFLPATVVAFDAERDLAVLDVPELTAPVLVVGADATAGQDVAVAGFPGGGPYDVQPGRVRDVVTAVGDDIYGNAGTVREVYSLFAVIRGGNSGGPLLSATGEVVGVVFARSVTDPSSGYATTTDELLPVLASAASATGPVDVGGCSVG